MCALKKEAFRLGLDRVACRIKEAPVGPRVFQPRVPSWNLSEKYSGIFLLFSVFEESVFFQLS